MTVKALALNLGTVTAWAVTGGQLGVIDLTPHLGHLGRRAYVFSNALADLLDEHAPTQLSVMRQVPDGNKSARLIDHLALLVHGVAYPYQLEPIELPPTPSAPGFSAMGGRQST
jgi:hypothetical protein